MDYITRETGAFPVSIGTSLAIEGLLGRHPNQPKRPPGYKRIREVWVNLRTLIRNFYASMTAEQQSQVSLEQAIELLNEEVQVLPTVLQQETRGQVSVVWYLASLDEVKWQFPHAKYKEPHTEKQRFRHQLELHTLTQWYPRLMEQGIPVMEIKRRPATHPAVVALLTHYPHELLWRFQFDAFFLLESHTGKLKNYSKWTTKLKGVKDEEHIPFNEFTLQLFGEGTLFDAFPKKLRDEVKVIADIRHWTAVTTLEKMRSDIERYGGENLKRVFHSLLHR